MMDESGANRHEKLARLTRRERETLLLRAQGLHHREISERMHIGIDTVKKHLRAVYEKLEIRNLESQIQRYAALQEYGELMESDTPSPADTGPSQGTATDITDDTDSKESIVKRAGGEDMAHHLAARVEHLETELMVFQDEFERMEAQRYAMQTTTIPAGEGRDLPFDRVDAAPTGAAFRRRVWLAFALVALVGLLFGVVGTAGTLLWWFSPLQSVTVPMSEARSTMEVQGDAPLVPPAAVPAEDAGDDTPDDVGVTVPEEAGPEETGPEESTAQEPVQDTTVASAYVPSCGEDAPLAEQADFSFNREYGVIQYNVETAAGILPSDSVRTLTIDERGLWMGFFGDASEQAGVLHFNRRNWIRCPIDAPDLNVNYIATDEAGRLWVALEQAGIAYFDGEGWDVHTFRNGLTSDITYQVLPQAGGRVWAQTWEGISVFQDGYWRTPYSQRNGTLFSNRVHAMAFDLAGNIWVGHIDRGISKFVNRRGTWVHYTAENSDLGGNQVRALLARPHPSSATDPTAHTEEIWAATADGGVSRYAEGSWRTFDVAAGLPHTAVNGLALDKFNRVWAATDGGVAYFDDDAWHLYHGLPAFAVAFGPDCNDCPINDDQVWVATIADGITYSRIPLPAPVLDVLEVRYPDVVRPGEQFRPEIVVSPRAPYQFRADRGDAVYFAADEEDLRFGAWLHIPVIGVVEPGEPFVFTDYDNLFTAPALEEGVDSATFTSPWRMWMHTRYAGPPIDITFTVVREPSEE